MLAENLKKAAGGYRCWRFGGYPVTAPEVCDSFERGKPGTQKKAGAQYERPHHLHVSTGNNHCDECVYYWKNQK